MKLNIVGTVSSTKLSLGQEAFLHYIAEGKSVGEIAGLSNKTRQTKYNWKNKLVK